eukprot:TRINITY_DN16789_c0_g1_i1.p2 TRINITY_DN16789_c0_g1~~TRINITY_DN16789_c0_g1_i1.p2  ORF type:complete len:193 (-),score=-5.00 TRINITY_DN16789_c0_g1_i1:17-595(-)
MLVFIFNELIFFSLMQSKGCGVGECSHKRVIYINIIFFQQYACVYKSLTTLQLTKFLYFTAFDWEAKQWSTHINLNYRIWLLYRFYLLKNNSIILFPIIENNVWRSRRVSKQFQFDDDNCILSDGSWSSLPDFLKKQNLLGSIQFGFQPEVKLFLLQTVDQQVVNVRLVDVYFFWQKHHDKTLNLCKRRNCW